MTTVLAVYNSEGCVGRCDANCHNGHAPRCDCICGGKNHGVGLARAIANNHERVGLSAAELQTFAEAHKLKCEDLCVVDRLQKRDRKKALRAARAFLSPRQTVTRQGDLFPPRGAVP